MLSNPKGKKDSEAVEKAALSIFDLNRSFNRLYLVIYLGHILCSRNPYLPYITSTYAPVAVRNKVEQ